MADCTAIQSQSRLSKPGTSNLASSSLKVECGCDLPNRSIPTSEQGDRSGSQSLRPQKNPAGESESREACVTSATTRKLI
jgi:hypothetical protein